MTARPRPQAAPGETAAARAPRAALTRAQVVVRLRERLERDSYPRLQMALIVALTGGAGLLSSFLLLQAGVDAMALRYPLALACAYLVFLFLLWVWLRTRDDDGGFDLPDLVPDIPVGGPSPARGSTEVFTGGRGGDFAGGGGGASFDDAGALPALRLDPSISVEPPLSGASLLPEGVGDGLSALGDADELAIPLLVIALAIGLAFASVYIVWVAPVLFAELLADCALSYALYRRLRHAPRQHWLRVAFGRTALPFVATAVLLALVGWGLSAAAPGARTLGQALDAAAAAK